MLELAIAALADPTFRAALKSLLFEVGHDIAYDLFVRRQDPAYAASEDAVMAEKKAALTPEQVQSVQKALAALMSAGK